MNSKKGSLYVVATPIGNLGDMSNRAIEILTQVKLILAEDTRHAGKLLSHFRIPTRTKSFHDHNERKQIPGILEMLKHGTDVALVSDAGTPLVSDPGYRLVREARQGGITVTPVPGPCALTAALSASGLPTDRFYFEGFLPAKSGQRIERLKEANFRGCTLIFYESSHRIMASLWDMAKCFGLDREVTVAREISKKFETFYFGDLESVIHTIGDHPDNQKGEFVVLVSAGESGDHAWSSATRLLTLLIKDVQVKKACKIVGETFGVNKNELYEFALSLKDSNKINNE